MVTFVMHYRYVPLLSIRNVGRILTSPFIYAVLVPAVFLDIVIELYHRVCFPVYGIPYVKRSQYIRIDRHRLTYLTLFEKINCIYCGYANGLFAYVSRIAAETEWYWCGIKHQNTDNAFHEPTYQQQFLPYNDKKAFEKFISHE